MLTTFSGSKKKHFRLQLKMISDNESAPKQILNCSACPKYGSTKSKHSFDSVCFLQGCPKRKCLGTLVSSHLVSSHLILFLSQFFSLHLKILAPEMESCNKMMHRLSTRKWFSFIKSTHSFELSFCINILFCETHRVEWMRWLVVISGISKKCYFQPHANKFDLGILGF